MDAKQTNKKTPQCKWLSWHNCYEQGWASLITKAAFAHPAKFSYSLATRIVRHGLSAGHWKPGQVIGDPFGGIGGGGIVAAYNGLRWVGVELEPTFVGLARENFRLHKIKWEESGDPMPQMICGDSREFARTTLGDSHEANKSDDCQVVQEREITSDDCQPIRSKSTDDIQLDEEMGAREASTVIKGHVEQPKERDRASLSSVSIQSTTDRGVLRGYKGCNSQSNETVETCEEIERKARTGASSIQRRKVFGTIPKIGCQEPVQSLRQHGEVGYPSQERRPLRQPAGESSGDLQSLPHEHHQEEVVGSEESGQASPQEQRSNELETQGSLDGVLTSPPFLSGDTASAQSIKNRSDKSAEWIKQNTGSACREGYGDTPGNIGNLPGGSLDGAVTSPGFGGSEHTKASAGVLAQKPGRVAFTVNPDGGYNTEGNVSAMEGQTYWEAVSQVYQQMYLAMKSGAVAAIVVKDFIRAGKRVPLCDQTAQLLDHVGFTVFERCRCWLVKRDEHPGLFGDPIVKTKSRKSFFRRLCESKGSPHIDFEEVIWALKETPKPVG